MSKTQLNLIIGLILGLILGIVIGRNTLYSTSMMGMRNQDNSQMSSTVMDAHFIEQMIPHHEDAITMSKVALQKANHQEIKTLAQNIIDAQQREIDQMKSWYKEWYGRELPTGDEVMKRHGMMGHGGMHMGMMGNEMDLKQLENAPDFDKAFIEGMIPHHQMAVMMASMLKNGTTRQEMRNLADDIITSQTSEIDQMRQWYQNWY